jgi:endonuclease/exonuclease/phosphatase family metal-dependent hydrolase
MRLLSFASLVILFALEPYQCALGASLRVLTYNIHHSEGRDGEFDLQRIASVINAAQPDVVALQELDQGNTRSGVDEFQLNQLATLTNMQGYFGKTINYQGGEYGNGVLINPAFDVTQVVNRALPNPANREARAVLELRVTPDEAEPSVNFTLFATHLDANSDESNRLAQSAAINALVANSSGPAILAGDLNARPTSNTMTQLFTTWTDATNVVDPGISRTSQIDYVLYRLPRQWAVTQRGRFIVNATTAVASDHYPLLAVLELREPSADFDGDGAVTGADLLTWQRSSGAAGTHSTGDANWDGVVNGNDLAIWSNQFRRLVGPASAAVPEPSGVAGPLLWCASVAAYSQVRAKTPSK